MEEGIPTVRSEDRYAEYIKEVVDAAPPLTPEQRVRLRELLRTLTGGREHKFVPLSVGGRTGIYDELTQEAAVQVQPGMHVEFELSGRSYPDQRAGFEKILAGLSWAPDPGNDATWAAVADWAK
jgi:hypothetical protein